MSRCRQSHRCGYIMYSTMYMYNLGKGCGVACGIDIGLGVGSIGCSNFSTCSSVQPGEGAAEEQPGQVTQQPHFASLNYNHKPSVVERDGKDAVMYTRTCVCRFGGGDYGSDAAGADGSAGSDGGRYYGTKTTFP